MHAIQVRGKPVPRQKITLRRHQKKRPEAARLDVASNNNRHLTRSLIHPGRSERLSIQMVSKVRRTGIMTYCRSQWKRQAFPLRRRKKPRQLRKSKTRATVVARKNAAGRPSRPVPAALALMDSIAAKLANHVVMVGAQDAQDVARW
jgi:hypothetical protein